LPRMPITKPERVHEVKPCRHIQDVFIQELVKEALTILNNETADRTPR